MVIAWAAVLLLIAVGSIGFVLAPLRRRASFAFDVDANAADLRSARTAALQTIRELDFDYSLGMLTDEDYQELREQQKAQAITLLKAVDDHLPPAPDPWEVEIERAVQQIREQRRRVTDLPARDASTHRCPQCDWPGEADERYCSRCGAPLSRACPACHTPTRLGDRFCPHCGQVLLVSPVISVVQPTPLMRNRDENASLRVAMPPATLMSKARKGRAITWLVGSGLLTLGVVGGIAWVYFSTRAAQNDQRPLAQLPAPVQDAHALTFLPGQTGRLLVGHHGGLLAGENGGRSWRPLNVTGDALALAMVPSQPEVLYAAGHDLLLRSPDGGQTWQTLQHDLPSTDIHALAVDLDDPSVLYTILAGGGLYRSEDSGVSWTRVGDSAPRNATSLVAVGGMQRALFVATADEGVLSSSDGRSWANANGFVNGALPTRRITSIVFDPRSGDSYTMASGMRMTGALYAGTDRGLFKSIDGGGSWNRLPLQTDVAALAVDPSNSSHLLVVDGRQRVFASSDRGLTWRDDN